MKLVFDENLSPDLVRLLADLFPESISASELQPKPVSDRRIWELAREGGYAIISKDSDFEPLVLLRGHPPKFIWVRCGNRSVEETEKYIREHAARVADFLSDEDASVLVI
jgi:predicted nuclease of predicted toxin-antitoxin system